MASVIWVFVIVLLFTLMSKLG